MDINVKELSHEAWDKFAMKAERLPKSKNPKRTVEWALNQGSDLLLNHTYFALAEMDELFDTPSRAGFDRLFSVLTLFQAIGWARGVEALGPMLRIYWSKQTGVKFS